MYVIFVDTKAVNVDTSEKLDLQKGRRFVSACGIGWREGRWKILFDVDGKTVAVDVEAVRREGSNGKKREIVFQLESPLPPPGPRPPPANSRYLPSMRQYHGDYFNDDL